MVTASVMQNMPSLQELLKQANNITMVEAQIVSNQATQEISAVRGGWQKQEGIKILKVMGEEAGNDNGFSVLQY